MKNLSQNGSKFFQSKSNFEDKSISKNHNSGVNNEENEGNIEENQKNNIQENENRENVENPQTVGNQENNKDRLRIYPIILQRYIKNKSKR